MRGDEDSGIWRGDEGRGGGKRLKARGGCGLRDTVGGNLLVLKF